MEDRVGRQLNNWHSGHAGSCWQQAQGTEAVDSRLDNRQQSITIALPTVKDTEHRIEEEDPISHLQL